MKRLIMLFIAAILSADPKVVIIGGGLAGLTAAHRLNQKGIDVEVYEARNRVGGRVLTALVGGKIGELGGQNISDGGEAKNLHRLIDEFGLETIENWISPNFYYFHGGKWVPSEALFQEEIDEGELFQIAQGARNMKEVMDRRFDREGPLYQTLAVRLECYEGGNLDLLSPLYVSTLCRMIEFSRHSGLISLKSIKEGNALLPEKIASALGSKVHLSKILTSVSKSEKGAYLLTFQDGTEVNADILVLANPASTYEQIVFGDSVIPEERLQAIQAIRYGTNAKILTPLAQDPIYPFLVNNRMGSLFDAAQKILLFYYPNQASVFSPLTIGTTYREDWPMVGTEPSFYEPEYARDESFASYEGAVGYSWPNDPYARGSYSYIAAGQEEVMSALGEEQGELVKTLFAPIDQTLYFAGEHTSILSDVPGTMEAACESGERVARAIISAQTSERSN